MEIKSERITSGPKHHLFGFHDLLITNSDGDKYLSLEADTINRPPLPGELIGVGYADRDGFVKLGSTCAMNYPQGARQQWISNGNLFTVNNRVDDIWGTDIYDVSIGKRIDRIHATSHQVSPDGKFSYGLDYARLFRLGGYGYSGIADVNDNDPTPINSGITKTELETKKSKILVSVKQVAEFNTTKVSKVSHHYLTHLCMNPSGTRIAFLHRYFMADGGMMTRLMTIGSDGTGLRCLAKGFLSHFHWKDNETIYIFGRANSSIDALRNNPILSSPLMKYPLLIAKRIAKSLLQRNNGKTNATPDKLFLSIQDAENPTITPFAQGILTEDGHPMTNPIDNDWCVNDTYPDADGIRTLMLYNFSDNRRIDLGHFKMLSDKPDLQLMEQYFQNVDPRILKSISEEQMAFTRSGLHCDLHPRWTANGEDVVFDSIHEGTRQIYKMHVKDIIV